MVFEKSGRAFSQAVVIETGVKRVNYGLPCAVERSNVAAVNVLQHKLPAVLYSVLSMYIGRNAESQDKQGCNDQCSHKSFIITKVFN